MLKVELELTRTVTKEECGWLNREYEKGEKVYKFFGHTYGCISGSGTACSLVPDDYPFFELPSNALNEIKQS